LKAFLMEFARRLIRVGGATEVEVKERKDRVDDALHATRAAVEEGILPGGGIALLRSLKALGGLKVANDDQQSGVDIVRRALRAPVRQIADNAGEDGAYIVGKLLESEDYNWGFNAAPSVYDRQPLSQRQHAVCRETRRHEADCGAARKEGGNPNPCRKSRRAVLQFMSEKRTGLRTDGAHYPVLDHMYALQEQSGDRPDRAGSG
ncbi:chaperonin GroEL, partial [Novosphingobium sp. Rr 2-17]